MSDILDQGIEGALDHLVNQFADPLSCLRELIQNALDAGTTEIDIWLEFQESDEDAHQGVMILHLDDFPAGRALRPALHNL